ncbi:MAG: uroporphyrinogen-III C-methyltransferase [Limnobacter sp.]|nr:uroporphyrinogen-III C-methyltransferase [Limnobacter sp.]
MPNPTLVVTKPLLPEALSTQKTILLSSLSDAEGYNRLHFPIFELVPIQGALGEMAAFCEAAQATPSKIVVFVSPSALEIGMSCLKQWPEHLLCGVMGHQSALLARRLGIPVDRIIAPGVEGNTESEDSNGLFNILQAGFAGQNCEVLVCKGPRGREDFPEKLKSSGFGVKVLETYDRRVVAHNDESLNKLLELRQDAVLWITSSETASFLDQSLLNLDSGLVSDFRKSAWVLTTHPRITFKCKELGYTNVFEIATGIESVKTWMTQAVQVRRVQQEQLLLQATADSSGATPEIQKSSAGHETQHNNTKGQFTPIMDKPSNSGTGTSGLVKAAFLMSLVTLILLILMVFFSKDQLEKTRQAFGERIQKESTTLEMMENQVTQSADGVRELRAKLELIEKAQQEAASQRAALEVVYNNLLASRSVVSVSEIDQLVSIAKRQLFVLGNLNGAKLALGQALELLERTDRPLLLSLRVALEKDLADLNAIPDVNLLEHAIELDSVIESVQTLPMLSGSTLVADMTLAEMSNGGPGKEKIEAAQHNPNPFQWMWSTFTGFLSMAWEDIKGLVEITKVKSPEVLLISAKESSDLRNTLRLSLLNARISLLSRHTQLLKADLARSTKILDTYFDGKNPQVGRAKEVMQKLDALQLSLTLPELKNTTSALRLVQSGEGEKQ